MFKILIDHLIRFLQLSEKEYYDYIQTDLWTVWADFRNSCDNNPQQLCVGLKLTEDIDDEFLMSEQLKRWNSEPVFY